MFLLLITISHSKHPTEKHNHNNNTKSNQGQAMFVVLRRARHESAVYQPWEQERCCGPAQRPGDVEDEAEGLPVRVARIAQQQHARACH
jgi:hypothetical protein